MNAKDKANELGNKFYRGDIFTHGKEGHLLELEQAKKYALICVDEIIKTIEFMAESDELDKLPHWNQVKIEINNL